MAEEEWLVLSHAFNMDGRAASHTITDKIPHLLAHGIRPIVVSAATGRRDTQVEHHQVLPLAPAALRFDLRHVLRRPLGREGFAYNAALGLVTLALMPFYGLEKLFVRLETHWSWGPAAYLRGARIIRERRPAVLYSTGGANSAHWAADRLARRFDIPWIAEIHDPMVHGDAPEDMAARFARKLERRICERADVAIWFTEGALAQARARNPVLGGRGHVMIPGADAPQVEREPHRRGEHLVLAHFGMLSRTRNLAVVAEALRNASAKDPALARDLRLQVWGAEEPDNISREALRALPAGVVELKGRLEADPATGESGRDRAVRQMNAVDCLLLLHGTEPHCAEYIPSKLYEYLWTQRPILALVHRNPQMARMLEDLGHVAVAADDVPAVERALADLVARWRRSELVDRPRGSPYTVADAVRQLVAWARKGRTS